MTRPEAQLQMGFAATMAGSGQCMSLRLRTLAEDSAGLLMEMPFGVWLPQVTILDCRRLERVVQPCGRDRHPQLMAELTEAQSRAH